MSALGAMKIKRDQRKQIMADQESERNGSDIEIQGVAVEAGVADSAPEPPAVRATAAQQLKQLEAELKIHKEAWQSESEKSVALAAKLADADRRHEVVAARLALILSMIRAAERAHYELVTTMSLDTALGWREIYQGLLKAVLPLFLHRD
jgi:hypothetical protein